MQPSGHGFTHCSSQRWGWLWKLSLLSLILLPGPVSAQDDLTLGLVYSALTGSSLIEQLDQSQLTYQTLTVSDLTLSQLEPIQILFLANIEALNREQVLILSTWLQDRSKHLIVSGPLTVPADVESTFHRLVGAHWSRGLATAAAVQPTDRVEGEWAQTITAATPIQGGLLQPHDLQSQLVATWDGITRDAYAVVATPQTVYFGWEWGANDGVDQQWLEAALARSETLITANPTSDSETLAVTSDTSLTIPSSPPPLLLPPRNPSQPGFENTPPPLPPQLEVVNTLEMLAMRQELGSLLGRVESAVLLTQATQGRTTTSQYQPILAEARAVLRNLETWVSQGDHAKARQRFAAARDQLWINYPINGLTTLPEVRAIWLDRGTIVEAGSEQGLAQVFDRLANAGINTVFFETINAGYPIYPSRVAPRQNPLTRGWDPLAAAVKLAHERNIELHAWMWTFAVGNRRHNVLPEISAAEEYVGPVLTAYPDWASLDHRDRLFPGGTQPETWVDPANPEVRSYLLAIIQELIQDYNVDGIHLDYIRYPFQNAASGVTFGYGLAARQQFEHLTGVDPALLQPRTDRSLWQLWTQFRAEQVNSFVADTADLIRSSDPTVILSAAVYALPEVERVQKLQQDWEVWITRGDLDLLVPLTYAGNTRRLAQLVEPNLEIVRQSPVLFLPSLNLLDLPKVEFLDQMQVVRDLPTGGYSLFAARQLTDELQEVLSQSAISSTQIPYRDPLQSVQARFQVLQQEWDYLLDQDELRLLADDREAWLAQTQQVSEALEQVVRLPTPDHLAEAQTALDDLRSQFPEWMRVDALQNAYRVETWENRLAALEIMLRYGERVLPRLTAQGQ